MPQIHKQLKITKIFRKGATTKQTESNEELEEIQKLEQRLQEKQNELFQIQRNNCKRKACLPKTKESEFVKPEKIILATSVETLKRNIELIYMLTGVEVQSYVADDHCCVVFHMQHNSETVVKHGLRIDMHSDGGNEISKSTMPLGFNLKAVLEEFDKIMRPKCLGAIRRALVAYYDRLHQYEALKDLLNVDVNLFKVLDGTHIVMSFLVESNDEDEEQIQAFLVLDYRVYDIRPKTFSFKKKGLPEDVSEILMQQCSPFKKKPLRKAFKEAFMNDIGQYRLVRHVGVIREEQGIQNKHRHQKRFRPNKNYNNDDTFLPEDCTDQSDDEQYSE